MRNSTSTNYSILLYHGRCHLSIVFSKILEIFSKMIECICKKLVRFLLHVNYITFLKNFQDLFLICRAMFKKRSRPQMKISERQLVIRLSNFLWKSAYPV